MIHKTIIRGAIIYLYTWYLKPSYIYLNVMTLINSSVVSSTSKIYKTSTLDITCQFFLYTAYTQISILNAYTYYVKCLCYLLLCWYLDQTFLTSKVKRTVTFLIPIINYHSACASDLQFNNNDSKQNISSHF